MTNTGSVAVHGRKSIVTVINNGNIFSFRSRACDSASSIMCKLYVFSYHWCLLNQASVASLHFYRLFESFTELTTDGASDVFQCQRSQVVKVGVYSSVKLTPVD